MKKAITGVFENKNSAAMAVQELKRRGFRDQEISLVKRNENFRGWQYLIKGEFSGWQYGIDGGYESISKEATMQVMLQIDEPRNEEASQILKEFGVCDLKIARSKDH